MYVVIVTHADRTRALYTFGGATDLIEDFDLVPLGPGESVELWQFTDIGDEAELVDPNDSIHLRLRRTTHERPR